MEDAVEKKAGKAVNAADIATYITQRIRRGSLVPGQRIIEAEIIKATGGTRARTREALQRLSAEGIVVIEEFRGASVKRLSRAEVDQIYRTREVLEGLAAALFAERATTEERARLEELQAQMNLVEAEYDADRFNILNEEWHWLIIRASRNDMASRFLERLRVPIFRLQFSMFYSRDVMRRANSDHKVLTEALVDGDGARAEALMRTHVRDGLKRVASSDDEFFAK